MALHVQREGLNEGGLARPWGTVQQQPEFVRVALDTVLPWKCVGAWGVREGEGKRIPFVDVVELMCVACYDRKGEG